VVFSPILRVAVVVWSELLYITLTTAMFGLLWRYQARRDRSTMAGLVLVLSLAPLVRYIGVTNIATACLWLLVIGEGRPVARIRRASVVGLPASLPLAGWMLRNLATDGTLLGPRHPSSFALALNIERALMTMNEWFAPSWLLAVPIAVIGVMLVWLARDQVRWQVVLPLLLYTGIYTAWLVTSATQYAFQAIGYRLMAPIYWPLVVAGCFMLAGVLKSDHALLRRRLARLAIGLGLFCVVTYGVLLHLAVAAGFLAHGAGGYNTDEWQDMAPALAGLEFEKGAVVYSSYPDALYYLTDGELDAEPLPRKHEYNSPATVVQTLEEVRTWWPESETAYIITFEGWRSSLYTVNELCQIADIEQVDSFGAARVYEVKSPPL
jgi:hypothetical protein